MDFFSLSKQSTKFRLLTGLTLEEFENLLPSFEERYEYNRRFYTQHNTRRAKPIFTKEHKSSSLPLIEQKLFFILIVHKNNPLNSFLYAAFGLSDSKVSELIKKLEPILYDSLDDLGLIPSRNANDIAHFDETVFYLDGTERPIVRNKDLSAQKEEYSGKNRQHTVKNDIIASADRQIRWVSETYPGSVHDKTITDNEPINLRENQILLQDTGFQGHKPANGTIIQPEKKKGENYDRRN